MVILMGNKEGKNIPPFQKNLRKFLDVELAGKEYLAVISVVDGYKKDAKTKAVTARATYTRLSTISGDSPYIVVVQLIQGIKEGLGAMMVRGNKDESCKSD